MDEELSQDEEMRLYRHFSFDADLPLPDSAWDETTGTVTSGSGRQSRSDRERGVDDESRALFDGGAVGDAPAGSPSVETDATVTPSGHDTGRTGAGEPDRPRLRRYVA